MSETIEPTDRSMPPPRPEVMTMSCARPSIASGTAPMSAPREVVRVVRAAERAGRVEDRHDDDHGDDERGEQDDALREQRLERT